MYIDMTNKESKVFDLRNIPYKELLCAESNIVVLCPTIEKAKEQLNSELFACLMKVVGKNDK